MLQRNLTHVSSTLFGNMPMPPPPYQLRGGFTWHGISIIQVIFVAGARTVFTGDLVRVDDRGVMNLVKAMQVRLRRLGMARAGEGQGFQGGDRGTHTDC